MMQTFCKLRTVTSNLSLVRLVACVHSLSVILKAAKTTHCVHSMPMSQSVMMIETKCSAFSTTLEVLTRLQPQQPTGIMLPLRN